jgi:hypothetical protein
VTSTTSDKSPKSDSVRKTSWTETGLCIACVYYFCCVVTLISDHVSLEICRPWDMSALRHVGLKISWSCYTLQYVKHQLVLAQKWLQPHNILTDRHDLTIYHYRDISQMSVSWHVAGNTPASGYLLRNTSLQPTSSLLKNPLGPVMYPDPYR